jgi:3-hydroxyacyl-CoA dehydrogenase, NAD binding domain
MSYRIPPDMDEGPVAIVGAGTLGRQIAAMYAAGGTEVRIFDLSAQHRARCRARYRGARPGTTVWLAGVVLALLDWPRGADWRLVACRPGPVVGWTNRRRCWRLSSAAAGYAAGRTP